MFDHVLNQDVIWWPVSGTNAYGTPVFLAPVQLKARWEYEKNEKRDQINDKVITTVAVDLGWSGSGSGVAVGDRMMLGTVAALPSGGSRYPQSGADVWEVKRVEPSTDLAGWRTWRTAYL